MEKLFTVYQPNMDKFIKDGNFISPELADKHFKITNGEITNRDFRNLYGTPVCTIMAKSLGEVFQIGNVGPEEKITRLNKMHSVSVGDIVSDSTSGRHYIVSTVGFKDLSSGVIVD